MFEHVHEHHIRTETAQRIPDADHGERIDNLQDGPGRKSSGAVGQIVGRSITSRSGTGKARRRPARTQRKGPKTVLESKTTEMQIELLETVS